MPDLLVGLDEEQRAAVKAVSGPVCIIAGAGTGKTRTVTHRLAYAISSGNVAARAALAITHSKKAAAELSGRLHGLGVGQVDARTFHAAGLWVAGQFWNHSGRKEPAPAVLSERDLWGLWRDSLRGSFGREPDNAEVRDAIDEVGWARSQLVKAEEYPTAASTADRHSGLDDKTVVRCWLRYEEIKARLGRVDFADLLDIAAGLLKTDDEVTRAVRARWAYVTVDEYQDTDPAQQRLLEAILGDNHEVCVVGDPRQAIYSWKGADPRFLTGFSMRYPTAQTFALSRNYRSTPQILAMANKLAADRRTKPLTATCAGGPVPKIHPLDTEMAEAAWVAGAARKAIAAGTSPSEIAVLFRFNATQARFEAAFARLDIPTVIAEDVTFFERQEIRSLLVPFGQAARRQAETNGLELLASIMSRAGFDRDDPPPGLGAARNRWESQVALLELIEGLPEIAQRDAISLLSEINGLARRTSSYGSDGVTLATLHRAKGLEWDLVFVVGVNDGAIPSKFAESPPEHAEEERLLHVGVTRARRELHLTWPESSAKGWANRPSPFFALVSGAARPQNRRGQRRASDKKQQLGQVPARSQVSGASCAHCAAPLKGISARRLGICATCALSAPGDVGRRARTINQIATYAAEGLHDEPDRLVSSEGLLRLLDSRPESADKVSAVPGVRLTGIWATQVADALRT